MYEQHLEFITFARFRNLSNIDKWAETLNCPVICVDGTNDYRQTAANIANQFHKK
jgi:hypothetical protein